MTTMGSESVAYPAQPYGVAPPFRARAVLGSAPLRNRLTQTFGGGGVGAFVSAFTASYGTTRTFLAAVPIEAPCYAVRLGFVNPYNAAMTIASATVYPSDSPSIVAGSNLLAMMDTGAASYSVIPTIAGATNAAAKATVYFDNAGADVSTLNTAGTLTTLTIPANAGNPTNVSVPFTVVWSDYIPVTSIPRADGGTQHYLFFYVTINSASATFGSNFSSRVFNANAVANRGRPHYFGFATNTNVDYTSNISGTQWKTFPGGATATTPNPIWGIQYLTANPGVQIVTEGDSHSLAPTNDGFSYPLWRAAMDLSTPALPIQLASLAVGAIGSSVPDQSVKNNLGAITPSIIAYQPISRNDAGGTAAASLQIILAKALLRADAAGSAMEAKMIMNHCGLEPSIDGNSAQIAGFNDMRARLIALSQASGIPLIDASAVIGNVAGGAAHDYLAGFSDDNTHPNYAGAEALVPQATAILKNLIGQ